MKNLKQITKMLIVAIIISISLTACTGNIGKVTVTDLEKCLGNAKTKKDVDNLSKEQLTAMAKCMLVPMDALKKKMESMKPEEKEKLEKEYADAVDKSEYKEVLSGIDYDKIKELATSSGGLFSSSNDNATSPATAPPAEPAPPADGAAPVAPPAPAPNADGNSTSDCDQFIKDYGAFVDSYIKVLKKYKKNPSDPNILAEYTEVVQKATEMQSNAATCNDPKYAAKLMSLANKMTAAAAEMYK